MHLAAAMLLADHMVFSQGTRPMRAAYSNKRLYSLPIENEFDAEQRADIYKYKILLYMYRSLTRQVIYINGCGFEELDLSAAPFRSLLISLAGAFRALASSLSSRLID
jgi:hypothetical protein